MDASLYGFQVVAAIGQPSYVSPQTEDGIYYRLKFDNS
jgi:hypothetical protein